MKIYEVEKKRLLDVFVLLRKRRNILPGVFVVVLFYMGRLRNRLGLLLRILYIVLCFLVEENTRLSSAWVNIARITIVGDAVFGRDEPPLSVMAGYSLGIQI